MTNTKITVSKIWMYALVAIILYGIPTSKVQAFVQAPQCTLNTIVQPVNNGGTTLSWQVYNTYSADISGIGLVADSGMKVVYPTNTTTYTLTAYGYGGADTCTVTVQPVHTYSFHNGFIGNTGVYTNKTCSIKTSPDYVVSGGTGILSWNASGALKTVIDNGVGTVSDYGSRTIANIGIPQTFNLSAQWRDGEVRNCSATLMPAGMGEMGILDGYTNYIGHSDNTGIAPTVAVQYIAFNQVPYTGTNDMLYILFLTMVALGAFGTLFMKRDLLISSFVAVRDGNDC